MNIQQEFFTLMDSGGPIMWVILTAACGVMILLVWEALRVRALLKSARLDYQHLRSRNDRLPNVAGSVSPIRQLLTTINWSVTHSPQDIEKEININLVDITPKMAGSLSTIAILGSLLPMLGLLGTVTGMINVFEVIAINGSGKPEQMADGISQALLTTASGLIIAIPVIFLHHLLSRHINALVAITDQAIQLVLHRKLSLLKQEYSNEHG
ncbi:MAG: MotA/TolQ/ExbB proton channel family protein [Thiohalomonadales bacterium]